MASDLFSQFVSCYLLVFFRFDHYGLLYDAPNSFCSFSSSPDELSLLTFQTSSFLSVECEALYPPRVCVLCEWDIWKALKLGVDTSPATETVCEKQEKRNAWVHCV